MNIHRRWLEKQGFNGAAFDFDAGGAILPSRPRNPFEKVHDLRFPELKSFTVSRPDTPIPPKCHIHHLPPEILCCIFRMCGDPNPFFGYPRDEVMHRGDISGRSINFYSKAAVMLGRVCLRWLAISRGDPLLWTLVDLAFPTTSDLVIVDLCLKYSAGLPLTLQLYHPSRGDERKPDQEDNDNAILLQLMKTVARNAYRWEEISMHMDGSSVARLLRSLYASPLRSVNWWANPYTYVGVDGAPLQHLTHVGVFMSKDGHHIFTLLRNCPQLQAFHVRVNLLFEEDHVRALNHPPLHMPHLRILVLCGYNSWNWLFDCLTVPRLDRLEIASTGIQGLKAIEDMLCRSNAHLKMLTLMDQPHGHLVDTVTLLRSRPMERLGILRYVPYVGESWARPSGETPEEVACYLPPHIRVFTTKYHEAEDAYLQLSREQYP
ncbi:hypothetical protein BD626DRAFT_449007 [Schizophyllum amplum]|uniref:Uncharacterized protein n=1 Tax=Schizophyllum amplum TaxID=97359 RepID=A0A550D097_9AGAR|nr:hypothetical protein BD626DRAFT_449007 [Auriculariopsis ampla]